jgi:hypothetical protein
MAHDDYNKGLHGIGTPSTPQGWADWQRGQHDKTARDALERTRYDNLHNPGRNAPKFGSVQPSRSGGGADLGALAVFFLLTSGGSAVMALLYPLAVAAVALTYMGGRAFFGDASGAVATLAPAIPATLVWFVSSRIEHRLGRRRSYRALRHVARLLILAAAVVGIYLAATDVPPPASPVDLSAWISVNLGLAAALVVTILVAHLLLWKANRLRAGWHRLLEMCYLRSA